jgi:signal transduction histidine kinase
MFRLAALFALLFLTLTGALILTVLWIVEGTQRSTLVSANQADIATVRNGYREEGLDEAVEVVRQRLGTPETTPRHRHSLPPDAYMVIKNAQGEAIIGNLPVVTCAEGNFTITLPPAGANQRGIFWESAQTSAMEPVCSLGATSLLSQSLGIAFWALLRGSHWAPAPLRCWEACFSAAASWVASMPLPKSASASSRDISTNASPCAGRGDEWDRLAQAINDMLDRISALLENLQQVSSDVAHDLRTPLARLRNRLELARTGSSSMEDYSVAVSRAINDTDQLLSIFSALLRISQVEAGTRAQSFSSVCVTELLERIYQLYLPVAEDCHHPLSRSIAGGVYIRGDEELLTQMFSNLIENALHHTPAATPIRVTLELTDGCPVAAVIDGGPGIPINEREKVLRRFYRLSSSRSTEGHGLGLSLVAAVAELHGARLELADAGPGLRVNVVFRPQSG